MMLLKVEYEFFAYEVASSEVHELARQLRLQFADSPTLYVSWTWKHQSGPDSEPYSIAYSESVTFYGRRGARDRRVGLATVGEACRTGCGVGVYAILVTQF
jgi:hypothetical protein